MPIHLRPTAPIAPDALLPCDPGHALLLAQKLLAEPRMSNHERGLWGYHGVAASGRPLTIQATGIGGPSAVIVLRELAELGVRRAIRIGTCEALDSRLHAGSVVLATGAIAADGTSRELGAGEFVEPDAALTAALREAGGPRLSPAFVASTGLFYTDGVGDERDGDRERRARWLEAGARVVEMEAAPIFTLGPRVGVTVACLLVVSGSLVGERRPLAESRLADAAADLGAFAAEALAAAGEGRGERDAQASASAPGTPRRA